MNGLFKFCPTCLRQNILMMTTVITTVVTTVHCDDGGHDGVWSRRCMVMTVYGHDGVWSRRWSRRCIVTKVVTTVYGQDGVWSRRYMVSTVYGHDGAWSRRCMVMTVVTTTTMTISFWYFYNVKNLQRWLFHMLRIQTHAQSQLMWYPVYMLTHNPLCRLCPLPQPL